MPDALSGAQEERVDQRAGHKSSLADQRSKSFGSAQAA